MSVHRGFLQAILEAPADPAPRLVYADWLEEQGDATSLAQAEYLRVECALDAPPAKDPARRKFSARLRHLQAAVGDDWWRALDAARVEECATFAFRCPRWWDTLQSTAQESVRHCTECGQDVYYCRNAAEGQHHAAAGHCVAVDIRAVRLPDDLRRIERRRLLGKISPQARHHIPLSRRSPTSPSQPE